eukprot:gene56963-biopygen27270
MLLRSFDSIVELTQQVRCDDAVFADMLDRLREGKGFSAQDMKLLKARTLRDPSSERGRAWNEKLGLHAEFGHAPVICANNDMRSQINIERARAYARKTDKVVLWSVARDSLGKGRGQQWIKQRGEERIREDKRTWLRHNDRRCGTLAGMLPLVEGMPVALTEHIDKGRQLLKGTEGTLAGLWLDAEESSSASGADGEVVLSKLPVAALVKFPHLDDPVRLALHSGRWLSDLLIFAEFDERPLIYKKPGADNVLAQIRANQRHHQRPCSICKEDLSVDAFTPDHFRRGDDVRACIGCTQSRAQKEMKQREREAAVCSRSRNKDRINDAAVCAKCGQCRRVDFSEYQWQLGEDKKCNKCLEKQTSARTAAAFTCSTCGKDRGKAGFGAKELKQGAAKRCLRSQRSCGGDAGRDDERALWRRGMTVAPSRQAGVKLKRKRRTTNGGGTCVSGMNAGVVWVQWAK